MGLITQYALEEAELAQFYIRIKAKQQNIPYGQKHVRSWTVRTL